MEYEEKGGDARMSKKKIFIAVVGLVLGSAVIALPAPAYAANGWFGQGNFFTKLVEYISQKFGLDKTQVQSAVTDFQQQQKATITPRPTLSPQDILNREKTRLDNLVSQSKITTDQENAILAELAALRTKYPFDPQSNLTPDQRKAQMQNMQNDWTTWAKANNIDPNLIRPWGMGFGMGGRGFGRGPRGHWGPTPTP